MELKEVHYNEQKIQESMGGRRAFYGIIKVQFMQGLVGQFKEFRLYLNNKELLKALSQEGESSNLDLTRSFSLECRGKIGKGQRYGGEAKGRSSILDRRSWWSKVKKWQRTWRNKDKVNINKKVEVIELADWLALLREECRVLPRECLVQSQTIMS